MNNREREREREREKRERGKGEKQYGIELDRRNKEPAKWIPFRKKTKNENIIPLYMPTLCYPVTRADDKHFNMSYAMRGLPHAHRGYMHRNPGWAGVPAHGWGQGSP